MIAFFLVEPKRRSKNHDRSNMERGRQLRGNNYYPRATIHFIILQYYDIWVRRRNIRSRAHVQTKELFKPFDWSAGAKIQRGVRAKVLLTGSANTLNVNEINVS